MKILQENEVGNVLVDVNNEPMNFIAVDNKDNGVNGTEGMDYIVTGDGKFPSEIPSQM